jgi:formate/nitrite transporter FocA (FNT family)
MSDDDKKAGDKPDDEKQEEREQQEVDERSAPKGSIVYKAIRKEGEDELKRSTSALAFSGLAAGLSMGFSLVAQGILHAHLPEGAKWAPLVIAFGYGTGFLMVILGRQQLFTENTLTVILPLLTERKPDILKNVLRLWAAVLAANTAGALLFALVIAKTEAFDPDVYAGIQAVCAHAMHAGFAVTLLRGIFAGWLIALMVWLLPFAETARIWVILILTWLVGAGRLAHIVAGSVDHFFLLFTHRETWPELLLGFYVPALLGNILGGVSLVAAINHAQVVAGTEGEDV